jgi:aminopeptidase N
MLENWLGEDVLRDAIRSYIHTNAGSTVSTESFIEAFRPEVRSDVAKVLRSFATSTGVPTIRSHVSCTEDEPTLLIEQQPYQAPSPRAPGPSLDQRLWTVPVCLRDDSGSRCVVVDRPRIRVGLDRCPRWVHPNAGGSGYYYFQSSLQELLAIIERSAGSLTDAEASAVISNVVALLRSGDISVGEVMEVYVAVSREYPSVGLADVVPRYVGRLVDVTRTQELVQYLRSLPRHADAAHRLADDFDRGRERIMRARDAVKAWVRRREGGPPTRETWGLAGRSNDRELAMEAVRLLNSEQDGVYGALKLLSSVGEPRVLERALKELHPRHLRSVLALALGSPLSWRTALQVMLSSEMVRQSIGDEALFVAAEEWGCDPATARRVAQLGTMTASPRWRIDGVAHTIQECVAVKSRSRRDIDQLLNPYRGAGARRGHELNGNAPDR